MRTMTALLTIDDQEKVFEGDSLGDLIDSIIDEVSEFRHQAGDGFNEMTINIVNAVRAPDDMRLHRDYGLKGRHLGVPID